MHSRITLRGFKAAPTAPAHVLGELETAVMEVLWSCPGQTVNDVEAQLQRRRAIAHTTVLTTLDRMYRKGYVVRTKRGKAFVYAARYSSEEFQRGVAHEVLDALLGQFTEPAISTFVELAARDPGVLDQLDAMVQAKRRQLAGQSRSQEDSP